MTILTPTELTKLRQSLSSRLPTKPWLKAVENDTFQALDDWWESPQVQNGAAGAINPVMDPDTPTAGQRAEILTAWLKGRAAREIG